MPPLPRDIRMRNATREALKELGRPLARPPTGPLTSAMYFSEGRVGEEVSVGSAIPAGATGRSLPFYVEKKTKRTGASVYFGPFTANALGFLAKPGAPDTFLKNGRVDLQAISKVAKTVWPEEVGGAYRGPFNVGSTNTSIGIKTKVIKELALEQRNSYERVGTEMLGTGQVAIDKFFMNGDRPSSSRFGDYQPLMKAMVGQLMRSGQIRNAFTYDLSGYRNRGGNVSTSRVLVLVDTKGQAFSLQDGVY